MQKQIWLSIVGICLGTYIYCSDSDFSIGGAGDKPRVRVGSALSHSDIDASSEDLTPKTPYTSPTAQRALTDIITGIVHYDSVMVSECIQKLQRTGFDIARTPYLGGIYPSYKGLGIYDILEHQVDADLGAGKLLSPDTVEEISRTLSSVAPWIVSTRRDSKLFVKVMDAEITHRIRTGKTTQSINPCEGEYDGLMGGMVWKYPLEEKVVDARIGRTSWVGQVCAFLGCPMRAKVSGTVAPSHSSQLK